MTKIHHNIRFTLSYRVERPKKAEHPPTKIKPLVSRRPTIGNKVFFSLDLNRNEVRLLGRRRRSRHPRSRRYFNDPISGVVENYGGRVFWTSHECYGRIDSRVGSLYVGGF